MAKRVTMPNRRRIVLTGAWGGGKTALISELQADQRYANHVLFLPEAAPLARRIGFQRDSDHFEKVVLEIQHSLEDTCDAPEYVGDRRSMILHRGALDTLGFWCYQGKELQEYLEQTGTAVEAELTRYDSVILMQSTAHDKTNIYERYQKQAWRPSAGEAKRLEKCLEQAWQQHPRYFSIPNKGISWEQKSTLAKAILEARSWPTPRTRQEVNAKLDQITYPSSHQYRIDKGGRIRPSPSARERLSELEQVLPKQSWDSIIDVGCGKGMFLFWALQQLGMRRGIGVDASETMVAAGRAAADVMNTPVTILCGTLNDLHPVLPPADLVFVFHCYHHLYFGSFFGTPARPSHAHWFDLFNKITTDTLVFANPLDLVQDKIRYYREKGFSSKTVSGYNEKAILDCANQYFHLQKFTLGGGRPYIVMRKKIRGYRYA